MKPQEEVLLLILPLSGECICRMVFVGKYPTEETWDVLLRYIAIAREWAPSSEAAKALEAPK